MLSLLRQPRTVGIMACAALLSATNWGVFLWAVTHEQATAASLGYFMLPLVNVVIGITIFRESVDAAQKIAIGFAAAKMMRRVIGAAHVEDLETIADAERRAAREKRVIALSRELLRRRFEISTIEDVIAAAREHQD